MRRFILALFMVLLLTCGAEAATQVTSGFSTNSYGSRRVVCPSGGNVYYLVDDTTHNKLKMFLSTSRSSPSFSEQDATHEPAISAQSAVSCAINSQGVIDLVFGYSATVLKHITFSTSTNTWGTAETIYGSCTALTTGQSWCAIAEDSNDIPYVVYHDTISSDGTIFYTNRIGGSWVTPLQIDGAGSSHNCEWPDITLDSANLPCVSYVDMTTYPYSIKAAQGNANNATSFTVASWSAGGYNMIPSIGVDSSGNHYVTYARYPASGASGLYYNKHIYGQSWTTWAGVVTIDSTAENEVASLAINGLTPFIFSQKTSTTAGIWDWTNATGAWVYNQCESGSYSYPKARWSYLNNPSYATYPIDLYFTDGTNAWYDSISLPGPLTGSGFFFIF